MRFTRHGTLDQKTAMQSKKLLWGPTIRIGASFLVAMRPFIFIHWQPKHLIIIRPTQPIYQRICLWSHKIWNPWEGLPWPSRVKANPSPRFSRDSRSLRTTHIKDWCMVLLYKRYTTFLCAILDSVAAWSKGHIQCKYNHLLHMFTVVTRSKHALLIAFVDKLERNEEKRCRRC